MENLKACNFAKNKKNWYTKNLQSYNKKFEMDIS
jgi:hypothetical protein